VTTENKPLINSCYAKWADKLTADSARAVSHAADYTLIKQSIFIKLIIGHDRTSPDINSIVRSRDEVRRISFNRRRIVHNDAINMDTGK